MTGMAVIGAGVIGRLRAASIHAHPDTELLGVVDPDRGRADAAVAGTGARVIPDLETLLALPELEAVVVSSPLPAHDEAVVAALAAGKHVLCEKPLANTVDGCRRMVQAAARAGRVLAVGFNHRYYPAIAFVKTCLDEGRIGTVDHARVFGGHDGLHNFRADWQYRAPASGGGAMMDVGIHMTDLARYLVGDVTTVYGVASNKVWQVPGSEDNAMAVLLGPAQVPVSYHATWTEWKGYRFYVEVYGDRGMVRGYYAPMFNLLVTHDGKGSGRRRTVKWYPQIIVREKLKSWTSTAYRSFEHELADWLGRIGGKPGGALATGFDGLRAVEIAHAVYQSTSTGTVQHLAEGVVP